MSTRPRTAVRRLAAGRLISVTGGAAAYTALNFTVWNVTRSPWMQSLSLLLTFGVSGFLQPFAGALGDRFDRRRVMVLSEGIAAAFFTAMAFVHDPGILIALAFGSAIAELPFLTASRAAIPNLVERPEDISWANSLLTVGIHAGIAVGPLIGGVLLGLAGPQWVFGINAISFAVSLLITLTVHGRFQQDREASEEHGGLAAGITFLRRDPVLRRLSAAWFVFVLGMGMSMVADAPLATSFGAGGMGFGLLIACWGGGSVLGSAAGRWMNARTEPVWLVIGSFGIAATAFGVGFAPVFPFALGALLVMGMCDGLTIVSENSIMQRRTPDAVRSRTMAAFEALLSIGLVVAYLVAGPVLGAVGPRWIYRIGGLSAAAAAIMLVPMLRLRRVEEQAPPEVAVPAPEATEVATEQVS